MTVTDFMTKRATDYVSLRDLVDVARRDGLLHPGESRAAFIKLVEGWFRRYPDGRLPNGLAWFSELPTRRGAGELVATTGTGARVASVRVGRSF